METWTTMVVMGVARSVQNFNLEPIRSVDEWLWWVGEKRVKCDSDLELEHWLKGTAEY